MNRQLLQQSLDALSTPHHFGDCDALCAALREALAAPQAEPVAWYYVEDPWGANEWHFMTDSPESQECDPRDWTPLYAAPPAAPAPAAPVPDGMVPNAEEVICPNCAHQFRAIPENVQSLLLASGHEPPFTASPAAPVPDGWVMVPREPTEDMIQAAAGAWGESEGGLHNAFAAALRGGITASPAAPVVPNECEKIFTHKWLDPDCIEQGCKSLAAPVVREPQPEPVQRLMRFAGKKRSEVSNPCLTAREAIVIADWMQAHGIGTTGGSNG